jgi:hypothetical protein
MGGGCAILVHVVMVGLKYGRDILKSMPWVTSGSGCDLDLVHLINQFACISIELTSGNGLNAVQPDITLVPGLESWSGSDKTLGHIGAPLILDVNEGAVVGLKSESNVKKARPAVRGGESVGGVIGGKSRIQPLASYREAGNVGDYSCPLRFTSHFDHWTNLGVNCAHMN